MYLPKIKLVKKTGEILLPDGNTKIGEFLETFNGQFFLGSELKSDSQEVFGIDTREVNRPDTQNPKFKNEITEPSNKELSKGTFKRYFLRDKRSNNIVEIAKKDFDTTLEDLSTQKISVDWILTPPAKDVFFNGIKYEGSETKNKKNIERISEDFKGLDQYIQDYSQFIPESNIKSDKTTPPAESNTTFDIPSPS